MRFSRREAMGILAGGVVSGFAPGAGLERLLAQATAPSALATPPGIPAGPFTGTRQSLGGYKVPDWYRDAKFGMWAHWGPQSAAEYGDWYARRMYVQGEAQYDYHVKTYGHPTKFGFKDVIGTFKADKFDPDYLIGLYKKAGARYFCSMACHHDGFDMWNSKHQPRWNAAASGPKKDIVSLWRDAARNQGLRFAVSEHLSNSFSWFATAHLSDKTGPLAGTPYDGAEAAYADLYHDYSQMPPGFAEGGALANGAMRRVDYGPWVMNYYQRMIDLIDQHQPDILYTDGGIPYGDYGLNIVAHLYNTSAARNNGTVEALYTSKTPRDAAAGICILDRERGVANTISPAPWQTDTCIGGWHYDKRVYERDAYKTPKFVIDMLVDIVARNGNLMLNIPLPNSGMPDDKELKVIEGITAWMAVNNEGIYGSRPYKIAGEGPGMTPPPQPPGTRFNENARKPLVTADVRFTTRGDAVYAFMMGWPGKQAVISSLGGGGKQGVGKIQNVELLGVGKLPFAQDDGGLTIQLPDAPPCEHAVTFKINGAI